MTRDRWENLNGLWEYAVTASDSEPDGMDGQILVPFAIESALSGVGRSIEEDEVLWYERQFSVPKDWNGSRIMLNFGAVDWKAEVYVNGQKAGEHTGGYTPFSFDITDLLARRGRNTLRVKVSDRTEKNIVNLPQVPRIMPVIAMRLPIIARRNNRANRNVMIRRQVL